MDQLNLYGLNKGLGAIGVGTVIALRQAYFIKKNENISYSHKV